MPLNAVGWTSEEDENLAKLVQPNSYLYNVLDPSRKNILARESTWQEIAQQLGKPVEECKKRWRGLRDSYMRSKRRLGTTHRTKAGIFEKLQFLGEPALEGNEEAVVEAEEKPMIIALDDSKGMEQQVITDKQEYYEIRLATETQQEGLGHQQFVKIIPKTEIDNNNMHPEKPIKSKAGRKKSMPMPRNIPPIKILPKPLLVNGSPPKIVRYIGDAKLPEQRSQTIDKLIEKILKENTNEIDVFFRSMAASVKKLQPNLIPKVKMEVCNVIAKYEMQSFDKNLNYVG